MRKIILILSLFVSMQLFSNDKLDDLDKYEWQEIGRIEYKSCYYVSFSSDNRLLVKSGLFTLSFIDIHSYVNMKYSIVATNPHKLLGYLGLLFVPGQYYDISSSGLYRAEINLDKGKLYGNSIIIYKKVLIKDLIDEQYKNYYYWQKIKNNCIFSTCFLGTLGLVGWCIKNRNTVL